MASSNPRVRAIELEASRRAAADGQSSRAERFDIRNELRSKAGMGAEKRRRGGAAGVWDRNKEVIKPVATGLAGMFLTPAVAAGLGAAMGGLDRPGKGGIGLDVGGAVRGGLSGYGMGKIGQFAGGQMGVEPLFTPKPAPPAGSYEGPTQAMSAPRAGMSDAEMMQAFSDPSAAATPAAGTGALSDRLRGMLGDLPGTARRAGTGALSFVRENPELSAGIAQGLAEGYGTSRDIGFRREEMRQESQRRQNLARLLAPLYREYAGGL